jgi:cation:H+ antiporter
VAGLVGLVAGGQLTVDAAVGLARAFGVSEAVIGLTVVAVGTSLPELAASVVATWKGHADLAIGNLVGSNIFNLLIVLAVSAMIRPIDVPDAGHADVAVVIGLSLLLWMTSVSNRRTIIRAEAAILLAVYLGYLVQRVY